MPLVRPAPGRANEAERVRWLQRPVLARRADRDLAAHLDRHLLELGDVLHDVRLSPGAAPVDHVVVAPSGIWLVDSLRLTGRVTGRMLDGEHRLCIDGVDRTDLVDELGILRHAQHKLRLLELADVPIHRVVCVIDAEWPLMGRPFQVRGIWITWPRALSDKIQASGLLPIARAREIATAIREQAVR